LARRSFVLTRAEGVTRGERGALTETPQGHAPPLAEWRPRLLPGMLAGAAHGVIRVGRAVRSPVIGFALVRQVVLCW
jgi:hypothetical protein